MKIKHITLILIAVIISLAGLLGLVITTPTKLEDFRLETFKIIAQGVVIGLLGLWVKYIFDEAAKTRDIERQDVSDRAEISRRRREDLEWVFKCLSRICLRALDWLNEHDEDYKGSYATSELFTYYEEFQVRRQQVAYQWLVEEWQQLESDGLAQSAKKSYRDLISQIPDQSREFTQDERHLITKKCLKWDEYYQARLRCLAVGKIECEAALPDDW